LAIAIWRVGFSLIIIAMALAITGSWRQWRRLERRAVGIALGAGTMLAVHFWAWNTSVSYTTVAASVVLVDMQPVIVGCCRSRCFTSRRRGANGWASSLA